MKRQVLSRPGSTSFLFLAWSGLVSSSDRWEEMVNGCTNVFHLLPNERAAVLRSPTSHSSGSRRFYLHGAACVCGRWCSACLGATKKRLSKAPKRRSSFGQVPSKRLVHQDSDGLFFLVHISWDLVNKALAHRMRRRLVLNGLLLRASESTLCPLQTSWL